MTGLRCSCTWNDRVLISDRGVVPHTAGEVSAGVRPEQGPDRASDACVNHDAFCNTLHRVGLTVCLYGDLLSVELTALDEELERFGQVGDYLD